MSLKKNFIIRTANLQESPLNSTLNKDVNVKKEINMEYIRSLKPENFKYFKLNAKNNDSIFEDSKLEKKSQTSKNANLSIKRKYNFSDRVKLNVQNIGFSNSPSKEHIKEVSSSFQNFKSALKSNSQITKSLVSNTNLRVRKQNLPQYLEYGNQNSEQRVNVTEGEKDLINKKKTVPISTVGLYNYIYKRNLKSQIFLNSKGKTEIERENSHENQGQKKLFFCKSQPGKAQGNVLKTNQDSYIALTNLPCNATFFAVCDGHGFLYHKGLNGHKVSQFIKERYPSMFFHKGLLMPILEEDINTNKLIRSVNEMQNLIAESDINCLYSGSTFCGILLIEKSVFCINSGDSRAVLFSEENSKPCWTNLSRDHKPDDSQEYLRIISNGGRIERPRDSGGNFVGPARVYFSHERIPGLAMSRSLGDLAVKAIGVTAEPGLFSEKEIKKFEILPRDSFIILASDGLWEYMSEGEVYKHMKRIMSVSRQEEYADRLIKEATLLWKKNNDVIDDITVVLIMLNHS